ncbi:MAG: DNRLRE domain-containing protein, partial [Planctomycetes bacterium]|nr:DNRLRE domain-containing protein [Planctomycetota bacterium]
AADNTMYEGANHFSNGAGDHFFCGTNNGDFARRGLIRFDVAGALPAGAEITAATLTLYMSRTTAGTTPVSLFPVTQPWGEGASDAPDAEGGGRARWRATRRGSTASTTPGNRSSRLRGRHPAATSRRPPARRRPSPTSAGTRGRRRRCSKTCAGGRTIR